MSEGRVMRVLAITTSTRRGGVALLEGARVIAAASYDDERGHAERVFGAIDETLATAGWGKGDIEVITCDVGPGSFTGVRVGLAAAKGISLARGLPLFGCLSLEAMAAAARGEGLAAPADVVLALIDAKKGEVFAAAYRGDGAVRFEPSHLARGDVAALVRTLEGEGGLVVVGEIASEIEGLAMSIPRGEAFDLPDAAWVGRVSLACAGAAAGDPEALEAKYVRAPDAKPSA